MFPHKIWKQGLELYLSSNFKIFSSTYVSHSPVRVEGPFLESTVSQVSCGWKHTAAISGSISLSKTYLFPFSLGKLFWNFVFFLIKIWNLFADNNVFTWGWGGSHGTFSVDGHSSGGQLVCFIILLIFQISETILWQINFLSSYVNVISFHFQRNLASKRINDMVW